MTNEQIAELGPAFADYLKRFQSCFVHDRSEANFAVYCQGLLCPLPRKSIEPIALHSGTAVRTLQEFLKTSTWDHERALDLLQESHAATLARLPRGDVGCVGVIDETSCRKWGDKTPGVQRQYLGCVGKVDNGIVTVHVGVAQGDYQALLDADLFVSEKWAADRDRCREAGIPDAVVYRPKWRIALDQVVRLSRNGVRFDWLTFDEYYGSKPAFLWLLSQVGQKYVAEVPVSFAVGDAGGGPAVRADARQPAGDGAGWDRFEFERKTTASQVWRARGMRVWAADGWQTLVTAVNVRTGEVKYFVTNAVDADLGTVLRVAFRRATIEHGFRLAKQEAGLMHYEGRDYRALIRHLTLCLITMGFVAVQTHRLRGEKTGDDGGAGVPGAERAVPAGVRGPAGARGRRRSDTVSSNAKRTVVRIAEEATA